MYIYSLFQTRPYSCKASKRIIFTPFSQEIGKYEIQWEFFTICVFSSFCIPRVTENYTFFPVS